MKVGENQHGEGGELQSDDNRDRTRKSTSEKKGKRWPSERQSKRERREEGGGRGLTGEYRVLNLISKVCSNLIRSEGGWGRIF